MKNVVCFGDSLTDIQAFGYSWTTYVQDEHPKLNIINSGRYGGMTKDFVNGKEVDWLKMHNAVMRHDPAMVLITLGGNDVVTLTDNVRDILNRYKIIVNYLRKAGIKVVMGVYDMTMEQCAEIVQGNQNHSKTMLKIRFSTYSSNIRSWSKSWVDPQPVISLYEGITSVGKIDKRYLRDAVHLSPEGAAMVGEYVNQALGYDFSVLEMEDDQ